MPEDSHLVEAVRAAIVASAHATAHERVEAAAEAIRRLGTLGAGRWRSAARDLDKLKADLGRAVEQVAGDLARRAERLDIEEEALWTVGDAAALYDMLRDEALELVEEGSPAARLLEDDALLFGVTFVDDPEAVNRGATLLFGWAEPLTPAVWPWEASWVVRGDRVEAGEGAAQAEQDLEELDLFEVGDLKIGDALLNEICRRLGVQREDGRRALADAAVTLTRVSMVSAMGGEDEEPEAGNGHVT